MKVEQQPQAESNADLEQVNTILQEFDHGNFKGGLVSLRECIQKLSPESKALPKALTFVGIISDHLGKADDAIQAWEEAAQVMEKRGFNKPVAESEYDGPLSNFVLVCNRSNGSGFSRKKRAVIYGPNKTANDEEEAEWKKNKFLKANEFIAKIVESLAEIPERRSAFRTKMADIYMKLNDIQKACEIYEQAHKDEPEDPEWLVKWADCLKKLGNKEEALKKIEQVLSITPSSVPALRQLLVHYQETGDTALEKETKEKIRFYGWVPSFCQKLTYTPEHASMVSEFLRDEEEQEEEDDEEGEKKDENKEKEEKKKDPMEIINKLSDRQDEASTEFLAAVCYHHYHGSLENRAFDALKSRAKDNEHVSDILFTLLENHGSVCTIKGVIDIFATIKHPQALDVLLNLLPQDIQMFPMHVPQALGKLEDPMAIPALIACLNLPEEGAEESNTEKPKDEEGSDFDSDDEMFAEIGNDRLVDECLEVLGSYSQTHAAARKALDRALRDKRKNVRDKAHCVLFAACGVDSCKSHILEALASSEGLYYTALGYLERENKDEEVAKLVKEKAEKQP